MAEPGRLVLIGQPVSHSLSPAFQNAALQAAGLSARYEALEVSDAALDSTMRALVREGAAGNVTVPHKERVAALCDHVTPLAARVGAVNTWWSVNGALHGDNTDVPGFDDAVIALLGKIPVGARVAVLGAGGAARAAVVAASGWPGASVAVWARSVGRAAPLSGLGPSGTIRVEEFMAHALRGADLVVNATTIGLRDDAVPVNPGVLQRGAAVLDMVYRRDGPTPFVRLARDLGYAADDGLQMLIGQGARSWQRWFALAPDREVMSRAARAASVRS